MLSNIHSSIVPSGKPTDDQPRELSHPGFLQDRDLADFTVYACLIRGHVLILVEFNQELDRLTSNSLSRSIKKYSR
jgi:hypothetical protein